MITKTIVILLSYLIPSVILATGIIESPIIAILLYVLAGLALAGIGMAIMHDANHGAYSKNQTVNNILSYTLDFLGCSSSMWKLQHNVLHHTYTNIHGHDEDIAGPLSLFRFSPHSDKLKMHKYQHIYVWFFYSILTLYWFSFKDFKKAKNYYKLGLIKSKKELNMYYLKFIPIKLFYVAYSLVLPIIMAPFSSVWIILGFVIMHLIAGLMLSVIFQLAHVVPDTNFPQADENNVLDEDWYVHQLQTTSNFSPNNPILRWYLGGLTNQIEHHLFPSICHIHYKKISKIIKITAAEYQIPYYVNYSFMDAVKGHFNTLKKLGN